MYILGFDIGGTKCAVVTDLWDGKTIRISKKKTIPTDHSISAYQMLDRLFELADRAAEMGTCQLPESGKQEYLEGVVNRALFG